MEERQLDIFKTKRQKGVKPKGPSEFQIHCTVADYLRHGIAPGWSWFHPANGELRNKATAGRLKRMGVKPGVSDIVLIRKPFAQLHTLELKRGKEKPTEAQIEWMTEVINLGGVSAWADNVEDAMAILRSWGAIRTSIHT
jgi:hypothetical protein